jgi:hypothetical protein
VKWFVVAVLLLVCAAIAAAAVPYWRVRTIREELFAAFEPVRITNCELKRFGNDHDGGYLMCANLLSEVTAGYSYGINGDDQWGCGIHLTYRIPIHQYDCYNDIVPVCPGGRGHFNVECVGPEREIRAGKPFDTVVAQLTKNGDLGKRLVVKMDVEGWEWAVLAGLPDHVLDSIDQLAVEFHGIEEDTFVETARRLRRFFHVANVHQNNYLCQPGFEPFPGRVFEVLFVNKRIATTDGTTVARGASPLDARNARHLPDCQPGPAKSEPQRIAGWIRRQWLTYQGRFDPE